jgi:hypothetical protein
MAYVLGRYVSEDEMDEYKQQDREEKMRARLEEMGRRGGPDAPEPCERCDGKGEMPQFVTREMAMDAGDIEMEGQEIATTQCYRCLGTGVQP